MDRAIYDEINVMNVSYGFHFLLYIVMSLLHFFSLWKLYWFSTAIFIFFITFSLFDLLLLFYPILPLVLTYKILSRIELTKTFKNISLIFIIISALFGLVISIILWINVKDSSLFFKEYPYNYPSSENDYKKYTDEIINAKNDKKKNKLCETRRCFLQSENTEEAYSYKYICNFDSSDDFSIELNKIYTKTTPSGEEVSSENLITCSKLNSTIEEIEKMNIDKYQKLFYNLCNEKYESLYKCDRFEKPKNLKLKKNYKCPKKNYITVSYLFGVFTIITDIILTFIPWSFDYSSYKAIVKISEPDDSNDDSQSNSHQNNTNQCSFQNDNSFTDNNLNLNYNENRNGNNNEEEVKKEYERAPTETIIIAPSKEKEENVKKIEIKKKKNIEVSKNLENVENNENLQKAIISKGKKIKDINFVSISSGSNNENTIKTITKKKPEELENSVKIKKINNISKTSETKISKTNNINKRKINVDEKTKLKLNISAKILSKKNANTDKIESNEIKKNNFTTIVMDGKKPELSPSKNNSLKINTLKEAIDDELEDNEVIIPSIEEKSNTNQIFINSILGENSHFMNSIKNDVINGSGNISGNIPSDIISGKGKGGNLSKTDERRMNKKAKRKIVLISSNSGGINESDEKK